MPRLFFFATALVAIALPSTASAATWTVCPAGCDYTDLASAEASGAVNSGDVIQVTQPGDYDADMDHNDTRVLIWETTGAANRSNTFLYGTSNDIIKVRGGGHSTFRGFTIDGDLNGGGDRCVRAQDGTIILEDVTIRDCDRDVTGPSINIENGSTVELIDSLITNSFAHDNNGGAIWLNGTLLMENSTITLSDTELNGGAIYASAGTVTITDADPIGSPSGFWDNNADLDGGAVYSTANATLTVSDTVFEDNVALSDGGAVVVNGTGTFTDATFTDNFASVRGGSLFSGNLLTDVTITGGIFQGDTRTDHADDGGAIYQNNGVYDINGTAFEDLYATERGGAIFVNVGDMTIDLATFTRNNTVTGNGDGSAIQEVTAGVFQLTNSTFMTNDALDDGTVRMSNGSQTLSGNWFEDNTCYTGCGLLIESTTTDTGSTYINNDADLHGGAVVTRNGAATITFDTCHFERNDAGSDSGGALRLDDAGDVTLTNVTMDNNTANNEGGHIAAYTPNDASGSLTITGGSFLNGFAGGHGGAIHTDAEVSLAIDGASFDGNFANGDGGAIDFWPQNGSFPLTIVDSWFTGNRGDDNENGAGEGGALWAGDSLVSIVDTRFHSNYSAQGGAIYLADSIGDFEIIRSEFCLNDSDTTGGAIHAGTVGEQTPRNIENSIFTENHADNGGSAIYTESSTLDVINNTFLGNDSVSNEGAVFYNSVGGALINNLVGENTGGGFHLNSHTGSRQYNAFYGSLAPGGLSTNGGGAWDTNFGTGTLPNPGPEPLSTVLLVAWTADGNCNNDQLWYQAGSPLIDAGDPAICDGGACGADRSDIGAYGGANVDIDFFVDGDGDGFAPVDGDCDDGNSAVNPNASEIPVDGVDSNCDGTEICYVDADGDGDGTDLGTTGNSTDVTCSTGGFSNNANDCDDTDALVNDAALEGVADGVDSNCDNVEVCFIDNDNDGYGNLAGNTTNSAPGDFACAGNQVSLSMDDCNDNTTLVNPGAAEVVGDGSDQDCDGGDLCYVDNDGDTFGDDSGVTVASADLDCSDAGESGNMTDCDDTDDLVLPGGVENPADGVDGNCDSDELCYVDADGDTYGDISAITVLSVGNLDCNGPGEADDALDCNDGNGAVNPGAAELVANGQDDNCDGDELCYADNDGDTFGDLGGTTVVSGNNSCTNPGESESADDCNDNDSAVNPNATELAADGEDRNCDGMELCFDDDDGDGFGDTTTHTSNSLDCLGPNDASVNTDCDDTDGTVNPDATEIVGTGIDEDCDGNERCYADGDGDGFAGGTATALTPALDCNDGDLSAVVEDCNDFDDQINPDATEDAGDLIDQDCDGRELCFDDTDADGYGTTTTSLSPDMNCDVLDNLSVLNTDCDDNNSAVNPGAAEITANGVDDDCNGQEICYQDNDNDTHGSLVTTLSPDVTCSAAGVSSISDDCDDNNPNAYPTAVELPANGVDENCDNFEVCYADTDDDGQGSTTPAISADLTCQAVGVANNFNDCDDTDDTIYTGAPEVPEDGIDQDCDGYDLEGCFEDADNDNFGTPTVVYAPGDPYCTQPGRSLVQGDCDDTNNLIYPGAPDTCDGVDDNCDGVGGPDTDEDVDQLTWDEEQALGTDGCIPDTDGDSLTDGAEELQIGSNPLDTDTDGDGVDDGTEVGPSVINPRDTDGDGVRDWNDLDDDGDGIDTASEDYLGLGPVNQDSDGDGIPDYIDVDDDGDTINTIDEDDEVAPNGDPTDDDWDGDGIANYLDTDDDGDTIPTAIEVALGAGWRDLDSDNDTILDEVEGFIDDFDGDGLVNLVDSDDDGDSIPTSYEASPYVLQNPDNDGAPNYLDLDSDNDTQGPDSVEGVGDIDNDGIENFVDVDDFDGGASDSDGDTLLTSDENAIGANAQNPDSDGDGVDDFDEVVDITAPLDSDGDGILDVRDLDDDGDGVPTALEMGGECPGPELVVVRFRAGPEMYYECGTTGVELLTRDYLDTDEDSIPDYLDLDDDGDGVSTADEDRNGNGDWTDDDIDGDGTFDYLDADDNDGPLGDQDQDGLLNGDEDALGLDRYDSDSDDDGIPDNIETAQGTDQDSDGDGIIDALDDDDDNDGIPTLEEGVGDVDGDGIPNYLDDDSDGDGKPDAEEGTGDVDCDGRPNWLDGDDADSTCEPIVDVPGQTIEWEGCDGCSSSGTGGAGWLAIGLLALVARRRED